MKQRILWALTLTAALPLLSFPTHALAWGDDGHKIVGGIAWDSLDNATRSRIRTLLDDQNFGRDDFIALTTWADRYRDEDRPPKGVKATKAANPQYFGTHNWHFVDVELKGPETTAAQRAAKLKAACYGWPSLNGIPASLGAPADDCVVDKINQFEAELADLNVDRAERIFAFKFLLHFVGDLHQPMHASDNNNQGGNCLLVSGGLAGKSMNLHSYWDTAVVRYLEGKQKPGNFATTLKGEISLSDAAGWRKGNVSDWAWQSYSVGRQTAYAFPGKQPSCTDQPIELPSNYDVNASKAARLQLKIAGVRLGLVLSRALS